MFKIIFFYIIFLINFANSEEILWSISTGNEHSHKFSTLEKINKDNIDKLDLSWVYKNNTEYENKFKKNNQTTPIYTGNSLIISTIDDYLISLNPITGKEIWKIKLRGPVAARGLTYRNKNLFVPTSQGVVVVDELNGKINKSFGKKGFIGYYGEDFLTLVPPIISKNELIVAHQKKIEKYSLPKGDTIWSLNLNGARIWSPVSFDKASNLLAVTTSNLINTLGNTTINPDYANSLLIVDTNTGNIKCNFKDTIHDHWDLDMVGPPIINKSKNKLLIYGFSKTGNIFIVDGNNCKLINEKYREKIKTKTNSDIPEQVYSDYQNKFTKPPKVIDLDYKLDDFINYLSENNKKTDYIKHITRNSLYGEEYIPLSINNDIIMYGIHGGFEWPGGTLDLVNNQIIVPSNRIPFIFRSFFINKKTNDNIDINYFLEFFSKHEGKKIYENKCQSCHMKNRDGFYEQEFYGAKYIPSLVGNSFKEKTKSLTDLKNFYFQHKFIQNQIDLSKNELKNLINYFKNEDINLKNNSNLGYESVWQLLLDQDGNYASRPPWGKITAFNLETLKINWEIPFGVKRLHSGITINGDINFGGVTSSKSGLFFATGTPDKFIRVFDSATGKELWKYKMESSGTAPPMTYYHNGEQYLIINASGGKWYGYNDTIIDRIYAFKIKDR